MNKQWAVWVFAFGYFLCYVPYSALTKALSSGLLDGPAIPGLQLLPVSIGASALGMVIFIGASGWWRLARKEHLGGLPAPTKATLLSGLCTAGIVATTTLAYTIEGASIVLMMLLMRGGVLAIAPIIDTWSKRPIHWYSLVGLGLAMAALVVAFAERGGLDLGLVAAIDVALYLGCYLVRLRLMSQMAKSEDDRVNRRYFVEEQLVAAPAALAACALAAWIGPEALRADLAAGFTELPTQGGAVLGLVILLGVMSQGTGIFGGLVLLERQENSFCVPVNRASSILAGVAASGLLALFTSASGLGRGELIGAGMVVLAIGFLSVPGLLKKA
jgi:hypothetical protein